MQTFSGRPASQNEQELTSFIEFLGTADVERYLEIGARHGDTFHAVMCSLPVGSFGVAVDLPNGIWGKADSQQSLIAAVEDLKSRGYRVEVVFANSQMEETRDIVAEYGEFDAVLIDGDHRYAGVKKDFKLYGEMAPIVAFHDIVGHNIKDKKTGAPVEVPQLWQEVKAEFGNHYEFVEPGSLMGIGVLWK